MIRSLLAKLGIGGSQPPAADLPVAKAAEERPWSWVLSHLSEGVLVLDERQKVLFVNPAAGPLLTRTPQEAVGLPLWEVLRHREVQELALKALNSPQEESREITSYTSPEALWLVRARRLPSEAPSAGTVVTFHDITQLRRLENTRKEFVANVSHELRTPLTALKAALETLLDGAVNDPVHGKDFLETAQNQVERLQRLIDDLLSLASLERSGVVPPSERGSALLREAAEGALATLKPVAQKNDIKLEAFLPDEAVNVAIQPDHLTQVFMNLLDNAVKYNAPHGTVTIAARVSENDVEVSVKDTGAGIPASDLPRIFERFYRVDKARSREMGGTGLGLAIVKHIVENNGGRVRAESVVGKGSTFYVTLPLIARNDLSK